MKASNNSRTMTQTLMRIIDPDHPHYRESGYLTGKVISVLGTAMAEMRIENCRHGTEGCFIKQGQCEPDTVQPRHAPKGRR